MTKKTLNRTKISTLCFVVLLIFSCFVGALIFARGELPPLSSQPAGSASVIASLEDSINNNGGWNASLQTIYDGIELGQTTVNQLQTAVDSINVNSVSAAEDVFYWYFELSKFGVSINVTTIEAALDAVPMLPMVGGLPNDYSNSGVDSFLVYNRYDLYAYQWAAQLGYETSKWNLSAAYSLFNNSVTAYGKPVLCVGFNQVGWGIGYGPRYYDEASETIDMYLTFWLLGIPDGMTQAQYWWNWTNSNLWDNSDYSGGGFYKYAVDWTAFECEAGSMNQIIWKLQYYAPSIPNTSNLVTDMETRALNQGWSSPQWQDYVVVHASGVNGSGGNPQERFENTISSWAAMLGFYGNMSSSMQSQVQGLLEGSTGLAPAWNLTLQSELYDNSTNMFRTYSGDPVSAEATADGAILLMMLSTVPITGSLAVPLEDCKYEDLNNVIDGGISNINLTSRTLTLSVGSPGTFLSMFGTNIFEYNLNSSGVWQLTFADDWNNITSQTLISALPSSRLYVGTVSNTPINTTISSSSDSYSTITPSGSIYVNYGDNQTFNYSANDGYVINQVLVDGYPALITGSYTFTNVVTPHIISVSSSPVPTPTPSPTPTPTPSPTPTPTPSPTSTPTPTPTPTPSPTPSATSSPTQTPEVTPEPTPTASPTPSSPQTISPTSSTSPATNLPEITTFPAILAFFLGATLTVLVYNRVRKKK